jgi:repressor LexA
VSEEELFEAGIFGTTPSGWTLLYRRKFGDEQAAMRWMRTKTESLQRQNPLGRVRGSIVMLKSFLTLEMVLAGYEEKRQTGDPEFNERAAVETVSVDSMKQVPTFTPRQGQFLAFIYYYTKLNGQPPAEADMQQYFRVSPPAVHDMILMLEKKGFIVRTPGMARSIRVLLPKGQLPDLE